MMNKTSAIFGMIVALVVGFIAGNYVNMNKEGGGGGPAPAPIAAAAPDSNVERFKVPVGGAAQSGPATAKVTIIEFSDYQCPYCSRADTTMEEVRKHYGKEVRLVYKHNPLSFHPNAAPAARAAMAAREQGEDKFWQFHSLLFKNQSRLDSDTFLAHAKAIGLNEAKFKADLDGNKAKYDAQIEADQKEAGQFGASGTPAFFINGRFLSGAQPFGEFKKVIDEEIAAADKALKAGASRDNLYTTLIQNGKDRAGGAPAADRPRPAAPQENVVYKIQVGNAAVRGPATAKVTIIGFSDFQCPYCARVEPTLDKIIETYGKDVRVAFKQNPLPMHPNAEIAALASLAAGEQGKFWEMHKKMFANAQALDRASLEKYAEELGLNVAKFKAALDSSKYKQQIADDQAEAARFGARGTPSFFINGRPFRGAQPFESFKAVIDKELEAANAKLKEGVAPASLYAELTKNGLDKVSEAPAAPAKPSAPEPSDSTIYKALLGEAPIKGARDAKVTIVAWSDFQCPFCSRVEPTVTKILEAYPKDVRVAFKQLPLPFHNNAHIAAEASLAAQEQGKFWQMHEKLFANQQALDRPSLEKYAQELGLNMKKFRAALDSGKFKERVDQELAEGNKIGASGTPSFFINGKSLVGAQPFEAFKAKVDEAIKDAEALMKAKRLKPGQVYDELMKDAKLKSEAPAKGGDDEAEDKTVYKVDPGNGPSWGERGAPVTIVEFSDFQCPYCSRVVPTIKQIKEKFAGKVRIVWRNFPLSFHQNAGPAAEAAMAAHEQGKFWEMHDKLFANQQALDRPSLDKYAQELGLDMGKFMAAMDGGKFKEAVNADVQYGNSLPGGGMGTPTFFINGRKIAGAYPFEAFEKLIKEQLAK